MRYSKWIVVLVIGLNSAFAAVVFYVFLKVGNEPSTLIASWFAFTTGELLALAGIKRKEIPVSRQEERGKEDATI